MDELNPGLFMNPDIVIRMGVPPLRIEMMSSISGVDFDECYERKITAQWDDITIHLISLDKLKKNKRATGRLKDQNDLEHLLTREISFF
jgi:hypothetical protein